jgi:hypothetical protein
VTTISDDSQDLPDRAKIVLDAIDEALAKASPAPATVTGA